MCDLIEAAAIAPTFAAAGATSVAAATLAAAPAQLHRSAEGCGGGLRHAERLFDRELPLLLRRVQGLHGCKAQRGLGVHEDWRLHYGELRFVLRQLPGVYVVAAWCRRWLQGDR